MHACWTDVPEHEKAFGPAVTPIGNMVTFTGENRQASEGLLSSVDAHCDTIDQGSQWKEIKRKEQGKCSQASTTGFRHAFLCEACVEHETNNEGSFVGEGQGQSLRRHRSVHHRSEQS